MKMYALKCLKCPYYLGTVKCIKSPCPMCMESKSRKHPFPEYVIKSENRKTSDKK